MPDAEELGRFARTLRVDAAAARVIAALDGAGVESILLKGDTHNLWAGAGDHRDYVDVDLLVHPASAPEAQRVLADLGYRLLTEGMAPAEQSDYGTTWVADDRPPVDLHVTIPLTRLPPPDVWRILRAEAEPHEVAGRPCLALSRRARLLHVSLHAAKLGPHFMSPAWDLARALALPDDDWRAALHLAHDLDTADAMAAGLRTTAEGNALADRLDLPSVLPLSFELRTRVSSTAAFNLALLLNTRGLRARARLVRYKVVPSPAALRLYTPLARRGRAGLIAAYARRPFVLAWRAARVAAALRRERQVPRGAVTSPATSDGRDTDPASGGW